MPRCNECGAEYGMFSGGGKGMCAECLAHEITGNADRTEKKQKERLERDAAIEAITLTTEAYPIGLNVTERIEVVTAECAFGMNIFKDLFAGVRDIVGGRSEAVQKTLRDSRRVALYELKREAHRVGANAVIGVDLDYVELVAAGNMILLVASGTAVRVEV